MLVQYGRGERLCDLLHGMSGVIDKSNKTQGKDFGVKTLRKITAVVHKYFCIFNFERGMQKKWARKDENSHTWGNNHITDRNN